MLFTFQPKEKLNVMLWYYYYFLQKGADTPYNVNQAPFNRPNAPASRDLGHEIDLIFNYTLNTLNARMDVVRLLALALRGSEKLSWGIGSPA